MYHGARASATDEYPITGHNYTHQHRCSTYKTTLSPWAALPPYGYISLFHLLCKAKKMLRPSFVTDAVQGRSRPSLRAGIVLRTGDPLPKTRVLSSAREGATNQEKGFHDAHTHLAQQRMTTATTNKLLFTRIEMNELNDPFYRIAASTSSGKCSHNIYIYMRHICITVCHMDRRFREAADRLSPEREREKQLVRIDVAPGF